MSKRDRVLADLVAFARIEVESGDLEPWAELLGHLRESGDLDDEGAYWVVKLYNAYDDLGSAWAVAQRWPSVMEWLDAPDADRAADYPCTQERRNLRGGRVLKHLASYAHHLAGQPAPAWVRQGLVTGTPEADFGHLTAYLRSVWGTGRQSAFEWAEFLAKVCGVPVTAADAQLWESEGPRRSLQRIFSNPTPDRQWLDDRATECRDHLAAEGVPLAWEDFETVICDFNVMRDGRYYPGRHLAALREELDLIPETTRGPLERAWAAVVPDGWRDIAPGIDKTMMPVYRDTGRLAPAVP